MFYLFHIICSRRFFLLNEALTLGSCIYLCIYVRGISYAWSEGEGFVEDTSTKES